MNYVVRMMAMTNCGYSPMHGFTVVVALQCWSKNKSWWRRWSVLNRSVMSRLLRTGLFWMGTILKHCYVFMSHEFQTVHSNWVQRKSPLILKVEVAIAFVAKSLASKIKT